MEVALLNALFKYFSNISDYNSISKFLNHILGMEVALQNALFKYFSNISDYNSISKFLNRILGMEVALQNALFKYFSNTLAAIILEAKRSGRWDMGILGEWQ